MKLPLRIGKDSDQVVSTIIDATGWVLFTVCEADVSKADLERILLSVNALGRVPLHNIRALYPKSQWPADTADDAKESP